MKKIADVTIVGERPLLYHAFKIQALKKKQVRSGSAGDNPEEWKQTVLHEGSRLFIPNTYIFATIGNGAKYVKVGRGTIAKKLSSSLIVKNSKSFIENRELPLEDIESCDPDKDDVFLDIRGVMNPNSKGRNVRYRVAVREGWKLSFSVSWNAYTVTTEQFKEALDYAGSESGLGDGRALGFGRFIVENVTISDA